MCYLFKVISVLRLLPLFSAFVILTSFLAMRPEAEIREKQKLVKVESFSLAAKPILKAEVKIKKSFEKCFWNLKTHKLSECQFVREITLTGFVSTKFQIDFGFTARPPPVSLT